MKTAPINSQKISKCWKRDETVMKKILSVFAVTIPKYRHGKNHVGLFWSSANAGIWLVNQEKNTALWLVAAVYAVTSSIPRVAFFWLANAFPAKCNGVSDWSIDFWILLSAFWLVEKSLTRFTRLYYYWYESYLNTMKFGVLYIFNIFN